MKLKQRFTGFGKIIKETFKGWNADDPFRQSSVIAYYAIFSLPALLVLIVNVVGLFFEKDAINGEISRQIEGVMGTETADQVSDIVAKAGEMKAGVISTIIAVVTLIFGATGVFVELQKTLNQIWDVKQRDDLSFFKKLKGRLFSFGLILSIGFLLLISLVVSSVLAAASNWLEAIFPEEIAYLFYALEFIVSLSVISVLFALMFKYLPDVKMRWKNVWIGAILTGFLFILGKYGLSFYFGKAQPASVYGAAGSIVLMLLWVSYSSMIVFFGAEFTKQYALFHNIKITPTKDAIKIDASLDEQQKTKKSESKKEEKDHLADTHHASNGYIYDKDYNLKSHQKHTVKKVHHSNGHDKISELDLKVMEKIEETRKPKLSKMKNREELQHEIARMERRLAIDGQDIKDDFKWTHIFGGLIPRALKLKHLKKQNMKLDDVIKGVARNHIGPNVKKEESFLDKIKKLIHAAA
ncbi:MAG: ribonuclease [Bacteroidetes bacterium]|nr:ribonuclease [Bacteroidota bacterium]